ncbi:MULTISPECIES: LacI family DNA-binding transcriptional regulator [Streptomyces]|uniref:LacI family DNA-binding transcriptional regulator n=1 Tax=Streptomyces gilvifuscus TaxID=1550617 RepID=A0ABT5FMB2_9ACTN|nr:MULTISPECIES: LacI family DNA-binding transcriptional regulator [Streptomyces]MBK3647641.1 LacI family DNA-binding transcriptional regulator [Streptomyces sp. MBT33]MDC2953661.1 LacI family DNA-binding transcriptional regulator [Streptomyces gilvifuscus]
MATGHGARGRSGGRPTLEEVAARAGVGRGTVSRVINGSPRVSEATRAAVEAAVAELGYVPNTAARALAANRTDAIALVVPEPETRFFAEPYFSDMLKGVGAEISDTEMQLLLIFAGSDRERRRLAQYLAAHRVDGVLLVSVHADDPLPDLLAQLEIPAVISGPRSAAETLTSVDSDNYGGGRSAAEHLLARGRHKIAHITGRLDVYGAQRRVDGYRDALRDAGHKVDEALIEPGDFTEEGGRRAMTRLLSRCPDLDAVFAGSDVMAAGARQVLREEGRRIPDDVALVGYDDSAIARHMDPPLTSVRQPIEEMGRRMIDLLLEEIADRRPAASRGLERRQVVLATELEARASS